MTMLDMFARMMEHIFNATFEPSLNTNESNVDDVDMTFGLFGLIGIYNLFLKITSSTKVNIAWLIKLVQVLCYSIQLIREIISNRQEEVDR